jgi:hypothetical protein
MSKSKNGLSTSLAQINLYKEFTDELQKDPARLKTFLRKIMGPPHITLEGKEKEHVLLMLALIEPYSATNNQHSWTAYYMIGETEYHVTTFSGEDIIVDKMLKEEE